MHLFHTGYVCPVLMNVALILRRLSGHRVGWKPVDGAWMVIETRRGLRHGWGIRCPFPGWLISLECRFWNGRAGLAIRSRFERSAVH